MLSRWLGAPVRAFILDIARHVIKTGISPNALTVIGLLLNVLVAAILASGSFFIGGCLTLFAGMFDMLDGAVARAGNRVSVFGGFLDSTLDRYSEAVLMGGLMIYFLGRDERTAVLLIYAALVGSLMISYTRARSEAAGLKNEAGVFARPERVILLGALLILNMPVLALWILAIGTNLTAAHRVYHVYRVTSP